MRRSLERCLLFWFFILYFLCLWSWLSVPDGGPETYARVIDGDKLPLMLDRSDHPEVDAAPKKQREWKLRGRRRARPAHGKTAARRFTVTGAMPHVELLERLGEIGATVDELGVVFSVSQVTVNKRLADHAELKAAWLRGKALSQISVRHLLHQKAQRPTSDGTRAALFLARQLIWPQDGDDGLIEKPPPQTPGALSPEKLSRLSPAEQEELAAIMEKLFPRPSP